MAYQSTAGDPANYNNYDAASILRTVAEAFGLNPSGLGGAATRLPMADFFQQSNRSTRRVRPGEYG
jgi:hypothetical protein